MQGPLLNQPGTFITTKMLSRYFGLTTEAVSAMMENMITNYGIFMQRGVAGALSDEGKASATGLVLTIKAFRAIVKDVDGIVKAITVPTDQTLDMTALENDTYSIFAQVKKNYTEPGTITLTNGSKAVVGVDTAFTKSLGKAMQFVITSSGAGNEGTYLIDTITDDTHATLKTNFTGTTETLLHFAAGAAFPDTNYTPSTPSDYHAYEMNDFEIIADPVEVDETFQVYLCDVVKGDTTLTITDKRRALKFKPHTHIDTDLSNSQFQEEKTFLKRIVAAVTGNSDTAVEHSYSGGMADVYPYHTDAESGHAAFHYGMGVLSAATETEDAEKTNWNLTIGNILAAAVTLFSAGTVDTDTIGMRIRRLYVGLKGKIDGKISLWNATNDFKATLQAATPTADRTHTFPDESGTVALTSHNHNGTYGRWRGFNVAPDNWPSNMIAGDAFANYYGSFIYIGAGAGTIALQNYSRALIGTSSTFSAQMGPKQFIVVTNSTLGNNGIYEVSSITTDTIATLASTFTGESESGLSYFVVSQISGEKSRRRFSFSGSIGSTGFLMINGFQTTQAIGYPLYEAGCITRMTYMTDAGVVESLDMAYDVNGANHFTSGSKVTAKAEAASKDVTVYKNNSPISQLSVSEGLRTVVLITIEGELDD